MVAGGSFYGARRMLSRLIVISGYAALIGGYVAAALWPLAGSAAETAGYSLVARVPGSGGAWDYAVVDARSGRLFLAQAGVTALDLKTQAVTTGLVAGKTTHGVAPLGDGTIAVDDSQNKVITIFDGATGKILSTIPTADHNPVNGFHALDAMVLEPSTGLLIAVNGDSGQLLLVDVKESRVAGTISLDGHAESLAADGMGNIYINVNHAKRSELVAVSIASRKVIKHVPLEGCEEATGLAYDQADHLVMSVCGNGVLKAFDTRAERMTASIAVAHGADAVMFDAVRRRAFVAGGDDGTLNIIAIRSNRDISVVQTLKTQTGTRLGAVDADTGRVYLPSAKFGPPKAPSPYPAVLPNSFEFLVAAPP
ncbi:MAG: gluconolactonase [Gammaproteobacteria bacterium]|nr:gluconolactonase [Gammaproteobacteria bacterium]